MVHGILRDASSKDWRYWARLEIPRCRRVPRSGEKVVNGIIGEEVEDTLRTAIYFQVDPIIAGANAWDRFVLFSRHHALTVRLSIPGLSGPEVAAMILSTGPVLPADDVPSRQLSMWSAAAFRRGDETMGSGRK